MEHVIDEKCNTETMVGEIKHTCTGERGDHATMVVLCAHTGRLCNGCDSLRRSLFLDLSFLSFSQFIARGNARFER